MLEMGEEEGGREDKLKEVGNRILKHVAHERSHSVTLAVVPARHWPPQLLLTPPGSGSRSSAAVIKTFLHPQRRRAPVNKYVCLLSWDYQLQTMLLFRRGRAEGSFGPDGGAASR